MNVDFNIFKLIQIGFLFHYWHVIYTYRVLYLEAFRKFIFNPFFLVIKMLFGLAQQNFYLSQK